MYTVGFQVLGEITLESAVFTVRIALITAWNWVWSFEWYDLKMEVVVEAVNPKIPIIVIYLNHFTALALGISHNFTIHF
jgi:hypothetical protein